MTTRLTPADWQDLCWHPGIPQEFRNQVVTGDARLLAERLPDESIDLIFTDPPYPKEYLHLYGWLAETAARVLKPGGSVFALAGHYHLPEVLQQMTQHLRYHWLCCLYQPTVNASYRCFPKRLDVYWKPILWLTKGQYSGPFLMDGINTTTPDKAYHPWGQGERWSRQFLDRFSPADIVLDPFTGGGTVPAVCKQLGRNSIAFEIDPDTAEKARERVRLTPLPLLLPEPELPLTLPFEPFAEKGAVP